MSLIALSVIARGSLWQHEFWDRNTMIIKLGSRSERENHILTIFICWIEFHHVEPIIYYTA
jgi:hypothetical protein